MLINAFKTATVITVPFTVNVIVGAVVYPVPGFVIVID